MKRLGGTPVAGLTVVALLAAPAAAAAFYGNGAEIVSAHLERLEQGDDASTVAAVSRDARHVAFQTRARNFFADDDPDPAGRYREGGIFRRDLETGALVLVADGDQRTEGTNELVLQGARGPSISADGRYVAFSTAQQLVPADTNDNVDVYVRDMAVALSLPRSASGAYTLVSAVNGGDAPATYEPLATPVPGRNPGTDVWPRSSISADGRRVVFRSVEVRSDLPDGAGVTTPREQLFVRDLDARTTRLITRRADDHSQPAGGAIGPAAISDDGSTVAWTGENGPAQTRFLQGEPRSGFLKHYLWQRIADGPVAPTRRITGAADVDDPACPVNGSVEQLQTATGPCYGPLTESEGARQDLAIRAPALSADGRRVAFLVSSGPRPNDQTGPGMDIWVTDMSAGVSRKAGSRELTREGAANDTRASAQVDSLAMSADGRLIAAVTARASFVLPGITATGAFRQSSSTRDVVLIDLAANTVERVTRGYDGSDTTGSALDPPGLSADGARVVFASAAPNLFFGDANQRADVFAATRTPEPVAEPPPPEEPFQPPQVIDETPPSPPGLSVRAKRSSSGALKLTVRPPSPGGLAASARGRLATSARVRKPGLRTLAKRQVTTAAAGAVTLTLQLSRRDRAALRTARRVKTTVRVVFTPADGGKPLSRSLKFTFSLQSSRKK